VTHHDHHNGSIEEIHLPGASLIPLFTGVGITIALVGLILSWWFVAAGGLITLIAVVRWIRDVNADIKELPTEHR
jgi:cytochrome c oxidase subunit IV